MCVLLFCHSKGHKRNTRSYNPEIFQSILDHVRKLVLVAKARGKLSNMGRCGLRVTGKQHSGSTFATSKLREPAQVAGDLRASVSKLQNEGVTQGALRSSQFKESVVKIFRSSR